MDYGAGAGMLTAEDEYHLGRYIDPACYMLSPTYDLIGANDAFRQCFPGLVPAPPTAEKPANFISRN
jgi:hypothetical protein